MPRQAIRRQNRSNAARRAVRNWVASRPDNMALELDFVNDKSDQDRLTQYHLTQTRTSTKYATDAQGYIREIAAGVSAMEHDPLTGVCYGMHNEKPNTNLQIHSQDHTHAAYTEVRLNTINKGVVASPFKDANGNTLMTGDELVEDDTATSSHYVYDSFTADGSSYYAVSRYFKANTRTQCYMYIGGVGFGASTVCIYDLAAGTVVSSGGDIFNAYIVPCRDGWYRCVAVAVSTGAGTASFISGPAAGDTQSYSGDDASSIYVCQGQIEEGAFVASSPIITEGSTITRDADTLRYDNPLTDLLAGIDTTGITVYTESDKYESADLDDQTLVVISDNSSSDYVVQQKTASSDVMRWKGVLATVSQFSKTSDGDVYGSPTNGLPGTLVRAAGGFVTDSARAHANGNAGSLDSSCDFPAGIIRLYIGSNWSAADTSAFIGYIRKVVIWTARINDTDLLALSNGAVEPRDAST